MTEQQKQKLGPLLIIIAGCFWGSMGILAAVVLLNLKQEMGKD